MRCIVIVTLLIHCTFADRYIEIWNKRPTPIWIQSNLNGSELVKIDAAKSVRYDIGDAGWISGMIWPKSGCDETGQNCIFGQSRDPCPSGGCQPPAETKVEFTFHAIDNQNNTFYDISLVDGYSMGVEIIPYKDGNELNEETCIRTVCQMDVNECPKNEGSDLGDLTYRARDNSTPGCLSPCKKWASDKPDGMGLSEKNGDGLLLCCPTPPISPEECRNGIVVNSSYVQLIRRKCPTAYSYAYDDVKGSHDCPPATNFVVNFLD